MHVYIVSRLVQKCDIVTRDSQNNVSLSATRKECFTQGWIHQNNVHLKVKCRTDDIQPEEHVHSRLDPPGVRFTL